MVALTPVRNSGSIKMHEQRNTKQKNDDKTPEGAVPAYLLDREGQSRAKVLSNMIKQKRKEKAVSIASSWSVGKFNRHCDTTSSDNHTFFTDVTLCPVTFYCMFQVILA